jgi:hypothetical protein
MRAVMAATPEKQWPPDSPAVDPVTSGAPTVAAPNSEPKQAVDIDQFGHPLRGSHSCIGEAGKAATDSADRGYVAVSRCSLPHVLIRW